MATIGEITGILGGIDDKKYASHNYSYRVVGIIGYLIGVKKDYFEDEDNPVMPSEIYSKLDSQKPSRIIRNLCIIRTNIEQHYTEIFTAFGNNHSLTSIPELIPVEAVNSLSKDGIILSHGKMDINDCLVEINQNISNRIQSIKPLFPDWLKWDYIKELFIMPGGFKKSTLREEGLYYKSDLNRYPYRMYMNWHLEGANGNILFCDEKFVTLLYQMHGDNFAGPLSLVRSASDKTNDAIKDFFEGAVKVYIAVDCENSNPIKLAAAISTFPEEYKKKIVDVALFDSSHTTAGWRVLSDGVSEAEEGDSPEDDDLFDWRVPGQISGVPMTHNMIGRVVDRKSQVDMSLAMGVSKAVFANNVDSVILISSDSDYYALINSLPDTRFMMISEREKTGAAIQEALYAHGVPYCFLDDFNTGIAYNIKTETIKGYIQNYLDSIIKMEDMGEVLEKACHNCWIEMTEGEKKNFYDRYIKKAHLEMDAENRFKIVLGEK